MTRKTPSQRLADLAKLYAERNKVYGDDYVYAGEVLKGFFPRGITLSTPEEFRRFYLFCYILGKLGRYSRAMARSESHADSLSDLAVYSVITQETDEMEE
jgi:hypothetical protein